ncbi:MAG: SpoIID/LytB domain-containing protein [Sandaracinaceae bacterium]
MTRRSIGCLATLLVLSACNPGVETPTPTARRITGVVVDGLTETPLSGVRVRTRDGRATATTDPRGRFQLTAAGATSRLWLDREGYVGGQLVLLAGAAEARAHLFPEAPTDAVIDAFFARQPVRRHMHPAHERPLTEPEGDIGVVRAAESEAGALPATIRVWRSGGTALQPTSANGWADNSCHPDAVVLELPREEYVKGVIPHEWFPSWHPEALRAGAIAARTYAVRWAQRGGRWDCADVDDGTVTQVYRDDRADTTNAAVDATAGQVVARDGAVISTEYSAENSDPTEFGVAEPTCTGTDRFGHGRGMCQWGTHRWASAFCANEPCDWGGFGDEAIPRDHVWMVEHYFPGACVSGDGVDTPPCAVIGAGGGIVDDAGPCFQTFGPSEFWRTEALGHDGGLHWTNAFMADAPSNWARWQLHFAASGRYEVEVFVEATFGVYTAARYEVVSADGVEEVRLDQSAAAGWRPLGTFNFEEDGAVHLLDNEDTTVPADQHIVADAVRLTPEGSPPLDAGPNTDAGGRVDGGSTQPRRLGPDPMEALGDDEGGCHVGGRPSTPVALLLLGVAALFVARRRR